MLQLLDPFVWLVEGHWEQVLWMILGTYCWSLSEEIITQFSISWDRWSKVGNIEVLGFFNLSYISIHCFFLSLSKTLLRSKYIIEMWSFLPFLHNTRDFKSDIICHFYGRSISCWLSSSLSCYNLRFEILHSPPYNLYLTFKGKKCQ